MTPAILLYIGITLTAASIAGMFLASDHPDFGTVDGGVPHWSMFWVDFLWAPALLGLALVFGAFACLGLGYGL